jgi:L,D-transpeptidase YcbB
MPPYRRGHALRTRGTAVLVAGLSWLALAVPCLPQPAAGPQPQPLTQRLQLVLKARFPASGKPPDLRSADGTTWRANPALPCFYDRRGYAPAWIAETGPRPETDDMLAALADAGSDGLNPEDYHLTGLKQLAAQARSRSNLGDLAELDLQLTDAFLRFAADLRYGRVNPELIYSDCEIDIPEIDLPAVLESTLTARNVRQALADLAPAHPGYLALKKALEQYREIAAKGAWPAVPAGPTLKPGEKSERVAALRARLEASGELQPATVTIAEKDLYDPSLEAAVKAFQEKNGLDADGAVGPGSLEALNVTAADRVQQIEVNLDRWRWLPRELGERYVMVNIAGFWLDVVESGAPVLSMRIVAGKPTSRTPMFTGTMTHLVLNPYWNVPPNILKNEVLPHIRRDSGYLAKQNMEMLPGGKVRQKPGPNNALGRVKFLFPNRFDVYLHDTPSRSLFSRSVRTFSHGCIRVEKPLDLAEYLLKDDPAWTREKIEKATSDSSERWVQIPDPLPVHLVYWTAWVDTAGVTQFRKDVYGRDKPLAEELGKAAPTKSAAPAAPPPPSRPPGKPS